MLGAARIAPRAIVEPAQALDDVEVAAVAARDGDRARAFAAAHGIPRSHAGYQALVDDGDVDAIYNALPNGLHGRWSIAAADAGKHVLCEKPFTANAQEAEQVASAADATGVVVMEAMHYRYHPLMRRACEIVESGALGAVRHVETRMIVVLPKGSDIRYRLDLAGGATMDVGCYAIHQLRALAGTEPTVTDARAKLRAPGVDRWMRADLAFDDGSTGRMTCALLAAALPIVDARVEGEDATLRVAFLNRPQMSRGITVRSRDGATSRERVEGASTFSYQLQAFRDAVLHGEAPLTPAADGVANMRVIDGLYEAAGLPRREPSP